MNKENMKNKVMEVAEAADNYYEQITDRLVDRGQKVEEKVDKDIKACKELAEKLNK